MLIKVDSPRPHAPLLSVPCHGALVCVLYIGKCHLKEGFWKTWAVESQHTQRTSSHLRRNLAKHKDSFGRIPGNWGLASMGGGGWMWFLGLPQMSPALETWHYNSVGPPPGCMCPFTFPWHHPLDTKHANWWVKLKQSGGRSKINLRPNYMSAWERYLDEEGAPGPASLLGVVLTKDWVNLAVLFWGLKKAWWLRIPI